MISKYSPRDLQQEYSLATKESPQHHILFSSSNVLSSPPRYPWCLNYSQKPYKFVVFSILAILSCIDINAQNSPARIGELMSIHLFAKIELPRLRNTVFLLSWDDFSRQFIRPKSKWKKPLIILGHGVDLCGFREVDSGHNSLSHSWPFVKNKYSDCFFMNNRREKEKNMCINKW